MVNGIMFKPLYGGRKDYSARCSGRFIKRESAEADDLVIGGNVTGTLYGLRDRYFFTGELQSVSVPPGVEVYVNGRLYQSDQSYRLDIRPRRGNAGRKEYKFRVTGAKRPVTRLPNTEPDDTVESRGVDTRIIEGTVYGKPDSYRFQGSLEVLEYPEGADLYVDDKRLDTVVSVQPGLAHRGYEKYRAHFNGPTVALGRLERADSLRTARTVKVIGEGRREIGYAEGSVFGKTDTFLSSGDLMSMWTQRDANAATVGIDEWFEADNELVYKQERYSGRRIDVDIHQTESLTRANGRAPERTNANALIEMFEMHNQNYRIRLGFPAKDTTSEKTGCDRVENPDGSTDFEKSSAYWWWHNHIRREGWIAKDSNILLINAGGGGCGSIGGNIGMVNGGNIDSFYPYTVTDSRRNEKHQSVHAFLHELGHELGARHAPGGEKGREGVWGEGWWGFFGGEVAYFRTPNNGFTRQGKNECGNVVASDDNKRSTPRVLVNQFSSCTMKHLQIAEPGSVSGVQSGDTEAIACDCPSGDGNGWG